MDIDFFKQINDGYGHQIGDWALKEVSKVIRNSLRQTDVPCRFGGDEMIIMLPRTNGEEAKIIAHRLQERIHAITLPDRYTDGEPVHLSISQGISTYPQDGLTPEALLEKADKALYVVKQNGRGSFAVYREVAEQAEDAVETRAESSAERQAESSEKSSETSAKKYPADASSHPEK